MGRWLVRRLTYANVMATLGVFLALGGGAWAVVRSRTTTVHGCVSKVSGTLRVLTHGTRCRSAERALAFNQKGPAGPAGSVGAPGAQGVAGPAGAPGAAIVARASGSSTVVTTSSQQEYPLTGNSWTQGAGEDDLIVGSVTIHASPVPGPGPDQCNTTGGNGLAVYLAVNGEDAGVELMASAFTPDITVRIPGHTGSLASNIVPFVLSTGSSRSATLTAKIRDDCFTTAHYTISAMRFDVIRAS